jgi:large subunit ribosomal protein L4
MNRIGADMTQKLNYYDVSGTAAGEIPIEPNFLELEKGTQAVHDVVVAYLAGRRAGTASTKNRGEVNGTGKKPFRQKGLGRARAGSSQSPVWRGGGIIFGPKPRDYSKKINRRVRQLALKRAFSEKAAEGGIRVIEGLSVPDHKTKNLVSVLKRIGATGMTLLVLEDATDNVLKAAGNVASLMLVKADSVNVYQLLRFDSVVFTKSALEQFLKRI